jgi:hypothetical protein
LVSGVTDTSLKDKNRWLLGLIIAANAAALLFVIFGTATDAHAFLELQLEPERTIPVGIAFLVATVLNGLLTSDTKYRLVFLRWHNVLPSHQAFTYHALRDARIDLARLEKSHGGSLPVAPLEQSRLWYRLYKTVENAPSVTQVHRDFLLTRDWTGLAVLLLGFATPAVLYSSGLDRDSMVYVVALFVQALLARQAASTYGERMVKTVLAEVGAMGAGH